MRLSGYCTNSVPLTVGSVVLCCLAVVLKLPEKKPTNKYSLLLKVNSSEPKSSLVLVKECLIETSE